MVTTDTPRVWIACLASYNAGRLIGEWVDATDADAMREATERIKVAAIAAATEAGEYPVYFGDPEEFAIHDYDGFPDVIVRQLGEYPDWDVVAEIGAALESDAEGFDAFLTFWGSAIGGDIDTDLPLHPMGCHRVGTVRARLALPGQRLRVRRVPAMTRTRCLLCGNASGADLCALCAQAGESAPSDALRHEAELLRRMAALASSDGDETNAARYRALAKRNDTHAMACGTTTNQVPFSGRN